MKKIFLVSLCLFITSVGFAQTEKKSIPDVSIKTLEGKTVSTSEIKNENGPIILSFFATWCKPCVRELTSFNENYDEWKEETGVKIVIVSVDDARTTNNVLPFVKGKGWNFDVYLDPNGDFKRAMNVNLIPHTFVLNKNREIVWQHSSYSEGVEDEIYEVLKKL